MVGPWSRAPRRGTVAPGCPVPAAPAHAYEGPGTPAQAYEGPGTPAHAYEGPAPFWHGCREGGRARPVAGGPSRSR